MFKKIIHFIIDNLKLIMSITLVLVLADIFIFKDVKVESFNNSEKFIYYEDLKKHNVYLDEPIQENINDIYIKHDNATITLTDKYYGKFKVLSTKKYNDKILPIDIALGWREMAKKENYDRTNITQSNRWYHWKVDNFFIPQKSIEYNSANTHFIPMNQTILNKLYDLKVDDTIQFYGYLSIIDKDNRITKSSRTRKDTGGGACEVVFITDLEVIKE